MSYDMVCHSLNSTIVATLGGRCDASPTAEPELGDEGQLVDRDVVGPEVRPEALQRVISGRPTLANHALEDARADVE
eukprot:6383845-Alexandrium_andersonii.AAC.1